MSVLRRNFTKKTGHILRMTKDSRLCYFKMFQKCKYGKKYRQAVAGFGKNSSWSDPVDIFQISGFNIISRWLQFLYFVFLFKAASFALVVFYKILNCRCMGAKYFRLINVMYQLFLSLPRLGWWEWHDYQYLPQRVLGFEI